MKQRTVQSRLEKARAARVVPVQVKRIFPFLSNTSMTLHQLGMEQQSNIEEKMRPNNLKKNF
jgi:hypothetical protein